MLYSYIVTEVNTVGLNDTRAWEAATPHQNSKLCVLLFHFQIHFQIRIIQFAPVGFTDR